MGSCQVPAADLQIRATHSRLPYSGTEAVELAESRLGSVAHCMRLLFGLSDNGAMFYTHSPLEPMLALGSAHLLNDTMSQVVDPLPTTLAPTCVAQDWQRHYGWTRCLHASPCCPRFHRSNAGWPSGSFETCSSSGFSRQTFWRKRMGGPRMIQVCHAYVNFSHWIVTKDLWPVKTDSWVEGVS